MATATTRLWHAVEHLKNEDDVAIYLEAALEAGDPSLIAAALGDITRKACSSPRAAELG